MSDKKSTSVSSKQSSKIQVSLSKAFSENGIPLIKSCPSCGSTKIYHLKSKDFHCTACDWKGPNTILRCDNSAGLNKLAVIIINQVPNQKDIVIEAAQKGFRLPVEVLPLETLGMIEV